LFVASKMAKRLYRSKKDRKIAGVCGGVAEYFEIDPTIVRVLWIASCFIGTLGIWLYLIAWLIVPEKP
jgi:phage shock protein C